MFRSMKLNGRELEEPRFSHFDLMKGANLYWKWKNNKCVMKKKIFFMYFSIALYRSICR